MILTMMITSLILIISLMISGCSLEDKGSDHYLIWIKKTKYLVTRQPFRKLNDLIPFGFEITGLHMSSM